MPLRRRAAQADRHTFELVDDGFADDVGLDPALGPALDPGGSAGPGDGGGDGGSGDGAAVPDPAARRRRRRVAAASAAVVVAVLGVMVTVDAAQSRADLARLREAPGGVAPMLTAPAETWSLDGVEPGGLEVLDGTLVLSDGDDVVAHDLGSGEERWRTDAGAPVVCGSAFFGYGLAAGVPARDRLVCLTDLQDLLDEPASVTSPTPHVASAVLVLDADGDVVGRRDLDAADGVAMPGPDGSLVRVHRVGAVPAEHGAEIEMDPTTGEPADVPPGRDVVVVLEDAVSGEVRWRRELPFSDGPGWGCIGWTADGGTERTLADLERLWAFAVGDLVQVDGCGVSAWFGADGTRLDDAEHAGDSVVPLPDGALYRDPTGQAGWGYGGTPSPDVTPAVLAPDGAVLWEPPGPLYTVAAADGRDTGLRLVRDGIDLAAYGPGGERLWSSTGAGTPDRVLTVAGGVVVVPRVGDLVALDAATGQERWTLESDAVRDPGATDDAGSLDWTTAFTDGDRLIATTRDWSGRDQQLVAVDLTDGEVVWRSTVGADAWPLAVQGALLVVEDRSVTRLG